MQSIATTFISLLALATSTFAIPVESSFADAASVSVSYDTKYDVSGTSLNTVSCSDGTNGLVTKYPTFGDLPDFPYIGGALTIPGWNSANCGACYQLQYGSQSIYVTAIDAAPSGFNIGLTAMNALTNNQAVDLGRVTATYSQVDVTLCKFPAPSS